MNLFRQLLEFFQSPESPDTSTESQHQLIRATLLLQAACYDSQEDPREKACIQSILKEKYGLTGDQVEALMAAARQKADRSVDLFSLTRAANHSMSTEERVELMKEIWQVIMADGQIAGAEDQFAGKMQQLLRLDRSDWLQAKMDAKLEADPS